MEKVVIENSNFDEEIDFSPLEAPTLSNPRYPRTKKVRNAYANPYKMDPYDVTEKHFVSALTYDRELFDSNRIKNPHEFRVQGWYARRNFRDWKNDVRHKPGMRNFRRKVVYTEEEPTNDENGVVIQRPVTFNQNPAQKRNNNVRLLPQSRVKGARLGDENFKPKLFTLKMGQEISKLRHALGLTQSDLAKKLNVEASMIRNIELGDKVRFNSDDIMVKQMAKILNVPSIKYQE